MRPETEHLLDLYQRLYAEHGPRNWWPTSNGGGSYEIICGAILTQNTQWRNAEKSLANMHASGYWSFPTLHEIDEMSLANVIRPSGYYNPKARKLKMFAAVVEEDHSGNLDAMCSGNLHFQIQCKKGPSIDLFPHLCADAS